MTITVQPSGAACGATVNGVDLTRPLSEGEVAEIRAAWLKHQVLSFPEQAMSDDDLERVMNVNCYGAVWFSRAFLPGMIENGWGRIINFTGMNSLQGTAGRPHVAMSKHAAWGLTKALSREFGPKGITANIISPGTFPDQDIDISQSEQFQRLLKQNPTGRLGRSDDIAAAVGLLCSDKGGFINAQLLQINGGVVG